MFARGAFSTFIYGTCELQMGLDGGCPPALCTHLDLVARA
jgi:hypothetical protein